MSIRAAVFAAIGALLAPGLVWAQSQTTTQSSEVVATAQPGNGAPATAAGRPAGDGWVDADDPYSADDQAPLRDRKIHGEVSAAVGTGGYREISGAVTAPIGDTGQATIAIDTGQYDGRRR